MAVGVGGMCFALYITTILRHFQPTSLCSDEWTVSNTLSGTGVEIMSSKTYGNIRYSGHFEMHKSITRNLYHFNRAARQAKRVSTPRYQCITLYLASMSLLLSGDIELCPGPCGVCGDVINQNQLCTANTDPASHNMFCVLCKTEWQLHRSCFEQNDILNTDQDVNVDRTEWICDDCVETISTEKPSSPTETHPSLNDTETDPHDFNLPRKGLRIGQLNVRSLVNKLDEVNMICEKPRKNFDIFGITETWITDEISDAELDILGHDLYRRDRGNGARGEVSVLT